MLKFYPTELTENSTIVYTIPSEVCQPLGVPQDMPVTILLGATNLILHL
jgi:hypothetical protein